MRFLAIRVLMIAGAVFGSPFGLLRAQQGSGPLALERCRFEGVEEDLLCGLLPVPEDREQPSGRTIALRVVVVPALDPAPDAAPLFDLAGGPGVAATGAASFYAGPGTAFRRTRDVVLVDQRGTGGSHPLRCPALEALSPLEEMYPVEEVRACRTDLERRADLTQYTTPIAAQDLDAVRAALGHERIDLWALSYGTLLAQVYVRMFPGRVRSAVLVGTVTLDRFRTPLGHAVAGQRALDLVFFKCQSDPACNAAFPELRLEWAALLERLHAGPIHARYLPPETSEERQIEIRHGPFAEIIRNLVGGTESGRRLPYLIHQAANGEWTPFLRRVLSGGGPAYADGLYLSIACPEGTARIAEEEVARYTAGTFVGEYRVREQIEACAEWPIAELPEGFFEPVIADIPVLLLTGEMDPPAGGDAVAKHLPNGRHVVIHDLGHVPTGLSNMECYDQITLEFYERAAAEGLDLSCIKQMEPPPFLLEAEPPAGRPVPPVVLNQGEMDRRTVDALPAQAANPS
jgi:pimeloyl-ACP methyl ester carboxylesterase